MPVCLLLLPARRRNWAAAGLPASCRDTSGAVLPGVTVEAASPALIETGADRGHRRRGPVQDRQPVSGALQRHVHVDRVSAP